MNDAERYLLIDGRRWRRSDPAIPTGLEKELVSELMSARRAVHAARKTGDSQAEQKARNRVQDAKVALGERGKAWWLPSSEEDRAIRIEAAIRALLRKRGDGKSICPSDAARVCNGTNWRAVMDEVRAAADRLSKKGWLSIIQNGKPVDLPARGPIRLSKR